MPKKRLKETNQVSVIMLCIPTGLVLVVIAAFVWSPQSAPLILLEDTDDVIKEGGVGDVNQHRRGRLYNMTAGRRAVK